MRRIALQVYLLGFLSVSAFSQTYQVTGVGHDDRLNVRADVDKVVKSSEAEVVGSIPHNGIDVTTTGVVARLADGSKWREIVYKDIRGWVNSKFLEEVGGEGLPENLNCSGTEPFWTLEIRGDKAELQDFATDQPIARYNVADKRYGINRTGLWSYHLRADDAISGLVAVVKHTNHCSPGMGNLEYAMEVYLLGLNPNEGPAQGCCSFDR